MNHYEGEDPQHAHEYHSSRADHGHGNGLGSRHHTNVQDFALVQQPSRSLRMLRRMSHDDWFMTWFMQKPLLLGAGLTTSVFVAFVVKWLYLAVKRWLFEIG